MSNNLWTGRGLVKNLKMITIPDSRGDYQVTDIILSIKRMVKGVAEYTLVPLEAWGKVSELCADLSEGDMVVVEGYFKNKSWQNKKKEWISKNLIVVEKIERV